MIKKITFWLLTGLILTVSQPVSAVPATPWPVEKMQPDGTLVSVYIRGDEKVHWMESMDGYTLVYDANRYIVYAEKDVATEALVPSAVRYKPLSDAPAGLKKGIFYSRSQVRALEQIWEVTETEAPLRAAAVTGSRKALCVLMGFSDKPFSKPLEEFNTLFNQVGFYPSDGSSKGSVRDFFRENSYGKLDFTVTLVGPYTASNTAKYFAEHPQEFAREAAQQADAAVDFNEFADNGRLETFHILFAGHGDENIDDGKQIWSHKWQLQLPLFLDGVRISVYSCSPELRGGSGSNTTYIGVVCHELTHVFGAPDYYDTSETGHFDGSGTWDLMANGSWNDNGRQPSHINIFQKHLFGWVALEELTEAREITAMPPSAEQAVAYSIKASSSGELYVLENRQLTGFDASNRGHGLLIWHVHANALAGYGSNDGHPQQLYPVVASSSYAIPTGSVASYGSISSGGTPFPGTAGKRAFTSRTTPAMFTWDNLQPIYKPLTDIKEASDQTVSFKFMSETAEPVDNLQAAVTGGNVRLTWNAPAQDAVGYEIYRDGVLQYTINNKATTTYTQTGVANGTYLYGVSALYETIQSEPVTISVTVSTGSDRYYLPVRNLRGVPKTDQAVLSWEAPFSGGWMTIAGAPYTAWSLGSITVFAGTLWSPEHLRGLDGYEATQIQFYLYEVTAGVTYRAQIWEIDATGIPVRVCDQAYTGGLSQGMKTVTLSSPLVIDASKEYLTGIEVSSKGSYCLTVDANPILPGRNWIGIGSDWTLFEKIPTDDGEGITSNFITSVYLSSGNPAAAPIVLSSQADSPASSGSRFILNNKAQAPTLPMATKIAIDPVLPDKPAQAAPRATRYAILRDGNPLAETTALTYTDTGLTSGDTHSYCVQALYDDGGASESVCTETTILTAANPYRSAENFRATLTENRVALAWDAPFVGGAFGYSASSGTMSGYNTTGIMAIRFTPEDLKKMTGLQVTGLSFYVHPSVSTSNTSYTLNIYTGGTDNQPGPRVYYQAISSFQSGTWTTVYLTSPYTIDIYQDLWIGIEAATRGISVGTIYRMASDNTPATDGKSNLLYRNGQWTTLLAAGYDRNWAIRPRTGIAPTALSVPDNYLLLRNGSQLASLPASTRSYNDVLPYDGLYIYSLAAHYADGNRSDPALITIPYGNVGLPSQDFPKTLGAYPNPLQSGQILTVQTAAPNLPIRIYSLSGTLVMEKIADGTRTPVRLSLPPGVYILSTGEERVKVVVR